MVNGVWRGEKVKEGPSSFQSSFHIKNEQFFFFIPNSSADDGGIINDRYEFCKTKNEIAAPPFSFFNLHMGQWKKERNCVPSATDKDKIPNHKKVVERPVFRN
jgi:hypothetical protein